MKQGIGELIKSELEKQERTITWFAGKIGIDRSNAYRLLKKNSIDTDLLMKISLILGRDFFLLLSEDFRDRQSLQQK